MMKMNKEFYSRYVSTHTEDLYGKIEIRDIFAQFKTFGAYFGRFLTGDKNIEILDLGCGNGSLIHWLHESGYKNSQGIDISEEQILLATKLGIKNILQADALAFLPANKNSFDIIFARDVLEHFSKDKVQILIENIFNSLKPGGIFIAQTVNAENWLWGRLRHGDFTHEIAFTSSSITQVLRISGFESIKVYPQRPVVHGFKSFFRLLLWMVWEGFSHLLLTIETGSSAGIFTQDIIVFAKK